ncbi:hypothetical protein JL721_3328 [Aureococcus anophagefferens]|nr:hypothetical protein JL721_3328 [Aureococcus anophagefferens]
MELGDADDVVFSDVGSKRKGGAIAKVTHGALDRSGYYEHALICALVPFLHDATGLYDDAEPATVRKKRRASAAASPAKKPKREAYVAASAWPEVGEPCRFLSGSTWFDGFVVERNAEGGVDMKFADKKYKGYRERYVASDDPADFIRVKGANTHVGLLDARERRHAEEVKRLRAMIDHAQRSADAGGASVAPADAPPPAPAAAGDAPLRATAAPARKAWLAVGLPTVPRADDADYLLQTLASFAAELPRDASDPAHGSAAVAANTHGRATRDSTRRRGSTSATRNARHRLRAAHRGGAAYFLFAEDDMKLCGHGLFAAEYVVRRAERAYPNFMAVRASFGMNGIFIHDADIAHFSAYMLAHQARRPPDHLVVEWFAGETEESRTYRGDRQHLGFRWNFFDHIGARSTLRAQTSGKMPACYEELLAPVVFPVEAYHPKRCPNHDFTPCGNLRTPALDLGAMRRFRAR